jgi:hypothetical protein
MLSEETNLEIIHFFETISKYYDSKVEITSGISTQLENISTDSTWTLTEFFLIKSAYRTEGQKFMFEGKKIYFEISAKHLINFNQKGRNKFEFTEKLGENVFRITKLRFHYKY